MSSAARVTWVEAVSCSELLRCLEACRPADTVGAETCLGPGPPGYETGQRAPEKPPRDAWRGPSWCPSPAAGAGPSRGQTTEPGAQSGSCLTASATNAGTGHVEEKSPQWDQAFLPPGRDARPSKANSPTNTRRSAFKQHQTKALYFSSLPRPPEPRLPKGSPNATLRVA